MSRKHFYIRCVILLIYTFLLVPFCSADKRVTVLNQGTGVLGLQYSPDGRWLAVNTGMVVLYDAITFQQKGVLLKDGNHLIHPINMVFSPDSTLLATLLLGSKIILWDVETATECRATQGLDAIGFSFGAPLFSPEGFLLARRDKRELVLWDIWRRRVTATIPDVSHVRSLTFRPDGKVLAGIVTSQEPPLPYDVLTFWDVRTGEPLKTADEDVVLSIDYSPDGRLFAVSLLSHTKLSRVSDGKVLHTFSKIWPMPFKLSMAFSPDSRFLAGIVSGEPQLLKLWDVETGEIRHTFENINSFALSPDGRTLVTSNSRAKLIFWDLETGEKKRTVLWRSGRDVIFNSDGTLIAAMSSYDPTIRRYVPTLVHWDIKGTKPLRETAFRVESFSSHVSSSPDGRWFAIAAQGSLEVVNTENGERLWRREQPFTLSGSIVFSPDGRFLAARQRTGTRDTRKYWVSVWETHSGIEYRRWSSDLVASLAFHPNGNILALVKPYGEIQLWDIHTGVMIRELRGNQTRLRSLAFSPDGKILATGGYFEIGPLRIQQTIQLWDVPTGKPLRMIKGMREGGAPPLYTIVFSPDGRMLAAANGIENNTVTLWSVADGREVLTIGGLDLDAGTLRFSPDGRRLVTTASATLVWHLEELLAPFPPTSVTRLKPVKLVPRPVLLPNFPNPANPETWIPYQLHKAANVRISIHDVRGRLVRVLNIGHRAEGQYTCHCKAAYWDGCNNVGERVSSGLYFYSISAGDFRASRKMVLRK